MTNKLAIVLNNATGVKKNKKIEEISNKIQKIEKLTTDFDILKEKIKSIKQLVDKKSSELIKNLCQITEKYLILLTEKYAIKGLTKWQKQIISDLITEELELLDNYNYRTEAIQEAINKYFKIQNDELTNFEKQIVQASYQSFLDDHNIDFEGEEFDLSKINDPEFKKQFEQKINEKQNENKEKEKQILKQEQLKKTDIDFQKIYKKLAKLAHPDLYKSEEEKVIKEQQMQKLTIAWEERDYYEIIMLWMEIDPENTIELEITEKNQKNIIKQLNEKINDLESEMYMVKYHFHDTAFYYETFNAPTENGMETKIKKYTKDIIADTQRINSIYNNIQKTSNLKIYLKEIYDDQEDEDIFDDFFSNFMK
jgi:hypothetical protein